MAEVPDTTAEQENRFHNYVGNMIPWYVHLIWLSFWGFAIWYVLRWLVPMISSELQSPP